MCNDHEQHIAWDAYCKAMQAAALKVPARQSERDLPQANDVRIGDVAPIVRAEGEEAVLSPMRFGFPPEKRGARRCSTSAPRGAASPRAAAA